MPRCTISVSPRSRSASRYFDRRRSRVDPRPGQPRARAAAGTASAGRAGASRRARSPGPRAPARGRGGPSRPPAAPANPLPGPGDAVAARPTCLIRSGGTDRKPASRMADQPEPTTHFGYETVPEAEKAARVHGVFASVADALRPDERRDEPRHPPALEGRAARLAGAPARHGAPRRRRRHRRHRLPLPRAGSRASGHATVLDMTEDMLERGPPPRRGDRLRRRARLGGRRRDGAPLRRRELRRLHHLLRHPQRHPHRGRARRGLPRAQARRPAPRPRVQPGARAQPALALRPLLVQRHPGARPGDRRRPRRATSTSSNRSAASPTRTPSPR